MGEVDELRRILTERGIDWHGTLCGGLTEWWTQDGAFAFWARPDRDGMLRVETHSLTKACMIATPQQAVEYTICHGTCTNEWTEYGRFKCSRCGREVIDMSTGTTSPAPINFCPGCGAKVLG